MLRRAFNNSNTNFCFQGFEKETKETQAFLNIDAKFEYIWMKS